MPRKIGSVTRQDLVGAPLPPATATYTVISHNFVITKVLKTLADNGFDVKEEQYRCTKDAQVASGIYRIDYGGDTDLGMMFAFGNSYDKSMRFKCAVGAYVHANQSSMISEMSDWNRKHTGTADTETQETIEEQVSNAMKYFDELKVQKDTMKGIEVVPEVFGRLLGELYLNLKLLTGEQMAIIKREYDKPSFAYSTGKDNLWTLYNHILVALKISHPRTWMEQQTAINYKLALDFNLVEFDDEVETADEKVIGVSNEGTGNAGMFLPNYQAVASGVTAEPIDAFETITVQNDMKVDEALETYPEMSKEIVEAAGVTEESVEEVVIHQETDEEYQARVANIEGEPEPEEIEDEPVNDIQSRLNLANLANDDAEMLDNEAIIEEKEVVEVDEDNLVENPTALAEEMTGENIVTDGPKPLANGNTVVSLQNYPDAELEEIIQLGDCTYMVMDIREENGVMLMELSVVEYEEVKEDAVPFVTDEEEDEVMEEILTEIPHEEAPTFDNTTIDDQEELEKEIKATPIESTGEVFDIEEAEVVPGIQPVVGLDERVEIMPPAEAKEKSEVIETQDKTSDLYITIKLELLELYGYTPDFTYTEKDDQYNVVLESGESVVLSAAYINSLND